MKNLRITFCLAIILFFGYGLDMTSVYAQPQTEELTKISNKINEIDSNLKKQSSWLSPSNAIPLVVALGGWLLAFYTAVRNSQLQEREKMREHLFDSLKWFEGGEGGSQKRSIGISVIEAHWNNYKDMQSTWRVLLVNQAIHLLTVSKEQESMTELNNLQRIMKILSNDIINSRIDEEMNLNLVRALNNANTFDDFTGKKIQKNNKGIFISDGNKQDWLTNMDIRYAKRSFNELKRRIEKSPPDIQKEVWENIDKKMGNTSNPNDLPTKEENPPKSE